MILRAGHRPRLFRRPRIPLAVGLRKAMFALPNLFTLSSVFCGFYAIVLAADDASPRDLYRASLAVLFGLLFDMTDGRVARLTRTQSEFGIELDSLADLVTFGVAPALIIYRWGLSDLGIAGALIGFVYVGCGALRLARFNVLARRPQTRRSYFIGMPIPLAAGTLVSLVMFHQSMFGTRPHRLSHVLALVVVVSYLMVSNVRYRTFKDVRLTTKSLLLLAVLGVLFVVMAAQVRPTFALLCLFSAYVALGLVEEVIYFRSRRREAAAGEAHPSTDITTSHQGHGP